MRDRTVCIPDSLDLDNAALAVGPEKASLTGRSAPLRAVPQAGGVDEPVHVQFAVRAALAPDAVAIEMQGESLTYGELQARAKALARWLRSVGVRSGSRVGLLLERSLDLPAAILGIWKTGGAYVPLDPHLPEARITYLIDDAIRGQEAPVIVVREPRAVDGICVISLKEVLEEAPSPAERGRDGEEASSLSDLAYLIYTSGTTGKPKAVEVDHGNLAHTLRAAQLAFGFEPSDCMPCLGSGWSLSAGHPCALSDRGALPGRPAAADSVRLADAWGFCSLVGESVLAAQEGEELTSALAELGDLSEEEIRALIERETRDFEEMV